MKNITHLSLLCERDAARRRLKALSPHTEQAAKIREWIEEATARLRQMERKGL